MSIERSVLILSEDGERVLFASPHCRIADNGEGALTVTDLCTGAPHWVRATIAQLELWESL